MSWPSRSQSVAMMTREAPLQGLLDGLELGGLVAAAVGLGRVEALRLEQGEGPSPPSRVDLLGLGQAQQMALGRQDLPVAVADRGPDVARLAAFLGDDHGLLHAAGQQQARTGAPPMPGAERDELLRPLTEYERHWGSG